MPNTERALEGEREIADRAAAALQRAIELEGRYIESPNPELRDAALKARKMRLEHETELEVAAHFVKIEKAKGAEHRALEVGAVGAALDARELRTEMELAAPRLRQALKARRTLEQNRKNRHPKLTQDQLLKLERLLGRTGLTDRALTERRGDSETSVIEREVGVHIGREQLSEIRKQRNWPSQVS